MHLPLSQNRFLLLKIKETLTRASVGSIFSRKNVQKEQLGQISFLLRIFRGGGVHHFFSVI